MTHAAATEGSRGAPGPITVLQVIDNLDIGGAQEVVVTLAEAVRDLGHRPVVCTLRDGPLRADLEASGTPVVCIDGRRHSVVALPLFVRDMWRIRRRLVAVVRDHDVDAVQTHLLRTVDFVVATLRWSAPRPLVYWTFHNFNFQLRREHLPRHRWLLGPKRIAHRWLHRWGSRLVDGMVAVSDEVRVSMLANIGPVDDRIVVIPNGVDVRRYGDRGGREQLRRELGLDADDFVAVMVATYKVQKGHTHLVDAVAQLAPAHPDLRVLLVGDGELRPRIEEQVASAGLSHVVQLLGSRRDVPALLAASDVFVLPSLWEGLPMALLEAMASGLPCVATDVSGTEQVVVDRVTGLLVRPGDVAALVDALSTLLDDRRLAHTMGAAGRERVDQSFGARTQARRLIDRITSDAALRAAPTRS